jgi:hypothetical protein
MVTGLPGGVASEAGADMSKNAPTVLIERVENGKTF